jgi:hypothetical protein
LGGIIPRKARAGHPLNEGRRRRPPRRIEGDASIPGRTVTASSQEGDPRYCARRSVLEPQLAWRLSGDALLCERDGAPFTTPQRSRAMGILRVLLPVLLLLPRHGWPARMAYRDIIAIRVHYDPTRFDHKRYRCDLRGIGGARTALFSTSYTGPGSFEDRSDGFTPFVHELVLRVQHANPAARVATGLSWPTYILQHGLVLAALLGLVAMLGVAGIPAFGSFWVKLAIIACYGGMLWRYARRNRPKDLTLPPRS